MNDKFLYYFAIKYKGDFDKVYEAICNKEQFTLQEYNTVMKPCKDNTVEKVAEMTLIKNLLIFTIQHTKMYILMCL